MSSANADYGAPPTSQLPPLPRLDGETQLIVFTHPSIFTLESKPIEDDDEADVLGDRLRLSMLGGAVLDTLVTSALFHFQPLLSPDNMRRYRELALSDDKIDLWLTGYGLRKRVLIQRTWAGIVNSPDESRALFNAYVGAVFATQGVEAAQTWIEALI